MSKQEILNKFQKNFDLTSYVELQTVAEACISAIYNLQLVTPLQEIERLSRQTIDALMLGLENPTKTE